MRLRCSVIIYVVGIKTLHTDSIKEFLCFALPRHSSQLFYRDGLDALFERVNSCFTLITAETVRREGITSTITIAKL